MRQRPRSPTGADLKALEAGLRRIAVDLEGYVTGNGHRWFTRMPCPAAHGHAIG
ncbi:hypothetical protein [Streptomyces sp. OspMP-M43]|uniref:hypothetical protein n=1 Tax=Streptomyces sp. OspMP-M43 TaxID=1839781 RepID=UPI00159EF8A6|nr:hypothetical protein [Streptomyces sp. OspMP-M43]